jgi:hypothetical protein
MHGIGVKECRLEYGPYQASAFVLAADIRRNVMLSRRKPSITIVLSRSGPNPLRSTGFYPLANEPHRFGGDSWISPQKSSWLPAALRLATLHDKPYRLRRGEPS